MSYDIGIRIGGRIETVEALQALVGAIAETDCTIDYDQPGFTDRYEILGALQAAGLHFTMAGRGDEDLVAGLQETCREIGLSYGTSIGYEGEDDYRYTEAYRPEWGRERTAGDGVHKISLEELKAAYQAAKQSGDLKPIEDLYNVTVEVERDPPRLEIAHGLIDEMRACIEAEEDDKNVGDLAPTL